jgi:hypothetical protein
MFCYPVGPLSEAPLEIVTPAGPIPGVRRDRLCHPTELPLRQLLNGTPIAFSSASPRSSLLAVVTMLTLSPFTFSIWS